jgi:SAM-dependent methyltransferase
MLGTAPQIDYDQLWSHQMEAIDRGSSAVEYWDRRAQTSDCSSRNSTYPQEVIGRMALRPEYSVLDVGCGCGALAIPLARKVKQVTALDISPVRLAKLQRSAAASGLTNISAVNQDWNLVSIGKEINRSDVVLSSRFVHPLLSETLHKILRAAKLASYIVWRATPTDDLEVEIAEAMGKSHPVYPDYVVIQRMLQRMGAYARVEIFETADQEKYTCLEEAALKMARGREIDGRQFAGLIEVARKHTTRKDAFYFSSRKIKWALISGQQF